MTPELLVECLAALRTVATQVERPAQLGPLEITVTLRGRLTAEAAHAYAELVSREVDLADPWVRGGIS